MSQRRKATTGSRVTFNHQVPKNSWYPFDPGHWFSTLTNCLIILNKWKFFTKQRSKVKTPAKKKKINWPIITSNYCQKLGYILQSNESFSQMNLLAFLNLFWHCWPVKSFSLKLGSITFLGLSFPNYL